ncbi:Predicted transcriptional regulator [Magnetospirillum sp. LM-5]|uniref:ArsR/SmtB family transcription factor n=1 Tax=Magnetospirillum sp. LM-5 TaxID=2681466 RepID=UPI00138306C0|nr:metalloregulator ArsR/SmtB family transcription factor [Magnetospirillum sp. LM-5]CAA7622073.1 Predicted transcriptional regulator [Magnetospirillum sp. LM-5]
MIETFETVAKAVADPSRVRILKLLEGGELCVCQITAVLDLAAATVSKHLAALKTAGLVQQRRDGKWIYYRLAERDFNAYTRAFLDLVAKAMADDPTVAADRAILARVNSVAVQTLCDQGRAVLFPNVLAASPCYGESP